MAGVTGQLNLEARFNLTGPGHGGVAPVDNADFEFFMTLAAGTGALGVADLLYNETLNIAASGFTDLDLNGVLKDPLGGNFNNAKLILMLFKADPTNVNNAIIGNAATNQFLGPLGAAAHTIKLEPGCCHMFSSLQGYPVTPATADLLRITNGGAGSAVNVSTLLIGRSS